ncbi:formylglycine-generating enzyme family protein [Luteimonas sp. e5]
MWRRLPLALLLVSVPLAALATEAGWVRLPAGSFRSSLQRPNTEAVRVASFEMMVSPVTNAQFLAFVRKHPDWQRGRAPASFAEARYLQHWDGPTTLGDALPQQPVVNVSWFAADAYCRAQGARLPEWNEWEYASAADETRRDARADPAWRERILRWYSRPSTGVLPRVGLQAKNAYGLRDLHGLVWEWTGDSGSLQFDGDATQFCGAGALSVGDTSDYPLMMRVAMLSSLGPEGVTGNLGFRCVR